MLESYEKYSPAKQPLLCVYVCVCLLEVAKYQMVCIIGGKWRKAIYVACSACSGNEPTCKRKIITSGKNFIKITSVGMGAAKSNETR